MGSQIGSKKISHVKARSHCTICDCDSFLLIMGCIGVRNVVAVTYCEHFHLMLYHNFAAIRGIAVIIRKNVQCK